MAEISTAGPRRPVIAIPARFSRNASALRYGAEVAARRLVDAVWAAGGEPLMIHPAPGSDDEAGARLWMVDGVLLPGGGDLSSTRWGEAAHPNAYDVDDVQDEFDLAVARWALREGVPTLAICRGNQVVNVALGGTLDQEMADATGADHRDLTHKVRIEPGTALREIAGQERLAVSCFHHQRLDRLGDGLAPIAWAADGTVEATELTGPAGWFLGVQWHPEDTAADDPVQAGLFEALVRTAGNRLRNPSPRTL